MADVINFTRGVPATESFPIEAMQAASHAALEKHGSVIMQYGKSTGFLPLREWLAEWQGVSVDQTMVSHGSLQLIEFFSFLFVKPGDIVFTEAPSYDRTITLLRRHEAHVVGIPIEADGPDLEALERTLKKYVPKFFYLIPDFQNPSGATCSREKRQRLVELAEQHDFWLVEDAPYRPLRYRGEAQPTLFELAPHRTLHMLSFSKLIGPGPRVGILFGEADLLKKVAKIAEDTYITGSLLSQGVVYEFCRSGKLPGQIEQLKALYAPRLQACLDALDTHLPDAQATRPDGGFFLSITLPEGTTTRQVLDAAKSYDLNLAPGQAFFPDGGGERFLRLPYCALTPEQIDDGISRLARAVKDVQRQA
ncbi:aminotransferase class I/II-fold pyridoxal phosphate-dependent enzyme [candidate division KSB3 bacterium]|uniref:Aminotransferase class I/II-fold pyridoxal phosphate-dependent enzyme n=1 Tax=candidate division KSB3 bacterium TaxID=2044937 RepID=A0A9D5JVA4_9BACT|nr:aminotransferase class I/II-fold pyridoxal phosphate-dependent enzyme [candidate division KSB3 bacterium]MBD3324577.1 aminotransferase class I/II-fold pyridoxal phosphate-dependent enzyme [candidate division KSB3 bacterium]